MFLPFPLYDEMTNDLNSKRELKVFQSLKQ